MSDFRVQIGSADEGRTFVRVIHRPTGKERVVVGIGDTSTQEVEARLTEELQREVAAEKVPASRAIQP